MTPAVIVSLSSRLPLSLIIYKWVRHATCALLRTHVLVIFICLLLSYQMDMDKTFSWQIEEMLKRFPLTLFVKSIPSNTRLTHRRM